MKTVFGTFILLLSQAVHVTNGLQDVQPSRDPSNIDRRNALQSSSQHLLSILPLLLQPPASSWANDDNYATTREEMKTSWRGGNSKTSTLQIPAGSTSLEFGTSALTSKDNTNDSQSQNSGRLAIVQDPNTYQALAYSPPNCNNQTPLILVLHGAGRNDQDIRQDLANLSGEHAGLIPSLIESGNAPSILLQNFAVLAPYSYGKPSFYGDSRGQLLKFCDWAIQNQNTSGVLSMRFDPKRIIVFGFSDGATVAVELLTTRRFQAGVVCSYGYSGKSLPPAALERLSGLPIWVFHSQDDVIFEVQNSDRLVQQLRQANSRNDRSDVIRYSRYTKDPENLPSRVRGHSMGITASKTPQLYEWMLQVTPGSSPI
jgi:predicted peptidase